MTPERWRKVEQLMNAALGRPPGEISTFLRKQCADDEPLRLEVESLLIHHGAAAHFLEASLPRVASELLLDDARLLRDGQVIGHYRVSAHLGSGGMGEVYLARDTLLHRKIALKVLPAGFSRNPTRTLRFEQEARAASALNHPNILTIYEIGESGGIRFIATEYVDGRTLRETMAARKLTLLEVLDVGCQALAALSAAHDAGIVHCDVKPDNIMLRQDGLVKVVDFGLATLVEPPSGYDTQSLRDARGAVIGTPRYMSPEQACGQGLDARTDVFSIGVVLYEMISGRWPFNGATTADRIASILVDEPMPLSRVVRDVPAELERVVDKSLRRDKERRYRSSREMLADMQRLKQELEYREIRAAAPGAGAGHPRWWIASFRRTAVTLLSLAIWVAAFSHGLPVPAGIGSIVVLPLENLSKDPGQEYFVDGMTDILTTDLAMIRSLRVIPRASAMQYKGTNKRLAEIARELNVDGVVTGTTARFGNQVRIDAQLIQAATERHLWAGGYTRDFKDVLTLQDEVARDIARSIQVELTPQEKASLSGDRRVNSEAYDAYLRGRYFMTKWTAPEFEKAVGYFQQSIRMDPGNALTHAELAITWFSMAGWSLPAATGWRNAESEATLAVELDDSAPEGHVALACVRAFHCDRTGAEAEFRRALELGSDPREYLEYHAWYLVESGRTEEALLEKRRQMTLGPFSPLENSELGMFLRHAHRIDEAIEVLEKTLEMEPRFPVTLGRLGWAYAQKGQYEKAVAAFRKGIDLSPTPQRLEGLVDTLRQWGKKDEAHKVLAELVAMAGVRYVPPDLVAGVYARLGDKEEALAWLEKATEEDLPDLARPGFEGLRSDPRFRRLRERFKDARPCLH